MSENRGVPQGTRYFLSGDKRVEVGFNNQVVCLGQHHPGNGEY